MTNIRKVKDDHEIDLIRKSVGVAEEAFDAIRDEIKAGQTENYLAGLLVFELRSPRGEQQQLPGRSSPPGRTARCRTTAPARRWCSATSRC